MLNDILANFYRVKSQTPPAAPGLTAPPPAGLTVSRGQVEGTMAPLFGKGGLIGDIAVGNSASNRSFTASNFGPGLPAVISGRGSALGDMNTLRTQGYTPEQATRAVGTAAAAELDTTNNRLRPGESAANTTLTTANTGLAASNTYLNREQGDQIAANAQSARSLQGAQARGANASALSEEQLTMLFQTDPAAYRAALGLKPLETAPLRQGLR